jgi:uncharacterized Zn-finger protein
MTFQFQCPQGHLLEADESYAGQQCNCPHCGMLFIIPEPPAAAPSYGAAPADAWPHASGGAAAEAFPGVGAPNFGGPPTETVPAVAAAAVAEPELLHIPCPNGHELESPREMLEQDVLCPHCGVQFRLRMRDSVEYKNRKQSDRERKEQKAGKAWLNWAIAIAVVVLLGLVLLIFSSSQ